MGQIKKIGDQYYIEFYARGLLYSQLAGPSIEEAQSLLNKIETTIAGGEALTVVRSIDTVPFIDSFHFNVLTKFSLKTQQRFNIVLTDFSAFLIENYPQLTAINQITPTIIDAYKQNLYLKTNHPDRTNYALLLLREMLNYGITLGFIHDNPTIHVKLFNWGRGATPKQTKRCLEINALFNKHVSLLRIIEHYQIKDIARLAYFRKLIPLNREDMYN